jgi:hypothetical protein
MEGYTTIAAYIQHNFANTKAFEKSLNSKNLEELPHHKYSRSNGKQPLPSAHVASLVVESAF